ncbi:uncharacterized protein FOKN1_0305 [Thiohalobacter thiocyanaticus]|uniref:DUF484 family protein n=1 Tax=Thiohalobacter thiocyanaticus TaxID=585455 RepID=A0A1Z4VM72_9GAMM|nr:DUF484 family protein [Thiohalobacter thiocyanaticus]BAZ92709.1 uncharacterized protein FOKN1_0305 [Thiohalobacter thiocyanaticus]
MNTQNNLDTRSEAASEIDAGQVADYLRRHPDFFEQQPQLLTQLELSHPSGAAVSLIERQVESLREQNRQYKHKLMELVQIGRDNDALHQNLHRLTVALMQAHGLEAALQTLFDHLYGEFNADAVALAIQGLPRAVASEQVRLIHAGEPALCQFERVLQQGQCLCGHLRPEQLDYLFGDRVTRVQSAALLPLGGTPAVGMLAIGNEDANYYHPGMDTHFLRNLSDLIGCALAPYLEAPEPA